MFDKIKEVFTKNYQEYVKYEELKKHMKKKISLKDNAESIDDKMNCLKDSDYVSNCHFTIDE